MASRARLRAEVTTMPARKTNRRKLTFKDREFLWYVRDDPDSTAKVLHVLSDDKRFVVKYELMQGGKSRPSFVIVVGREFPGLPTAGGSWTRLRCPTWKGDYKIDGKFVHRLLEWCFDAGMRHAPV